MFFLEIEVHSRDKNTLFFHKSKIKYIVSLKDPRNGSRQHFVT